MSSKKSNSQLRLSDKGILSLLGIALRVISLGQLFLAAAALGCALLPFILIWIIGAQVAHNRNFQIGLGWYGAIAILILLLFWSKSFIAKIENAERTENLKDTSGVIALLVLPIVMYFSVLWGINQGNSGTGPENLNQMIRVYAGMHLDVVTFGFFSAMAPEAGAKMSGLMFFLTRTIYTICAVSTFAWVFYRITIREENPLRTFIHIGAISLILCILNCFTVGISAVISLIPGPVTPFLALVSSIILQLLAIAILLPVVARVCQLAKKAIDDREQGVV